MRQQVATSRHFMTYHSVSLYHTKRCAPLNTHHQTQRKCLLVSAPHLQTSRCHSLQLTTHNQTHPHSRLSHRHPTLHLIRNTGWLNSTRNSVRRQSHFRLAMANRCKFTRRHHFTRHKQCTQALCPNNIRTPVCPKQLRIGHPSTPRPQHSIMHSRNAIKPTCQKTDR